MNPESPNPGPLSLDVERRRLYRVGVAKLAVASYALDAAAMLAFAVAGALPYWIGPAYFGVGAVVCGLFALLFRSGVADRARDPYLTLAQLASHGLCVLTFARIEPHLAAFLMSVLLVQFGWASLRLPVRQAVFAVAVLLAALGAFLYPVGTVSWMPSGGYPVRLLFGVAYATVLARIVLLGLYGAAVGTQLTARRQQLADTSAALAERETLLATERATANREVERRTAELLEAKRAAEASERAKSEVMARISHDVRSPMTGVIGMLTMLEQTALTDEQRSFVELAQRAAQGVLPIVDRAIGAGSHRALPVGLPLDDVDVRDLLDDCLIDFGAAALERRTLLEFDVAATVPACVRLDARRVRQALGALLDAAIAATERGTLAVGARWIPASPERGTLEITLSGANLAGSPTGSGVALPEGRPDASTTASGLAVCRRWVEELGGMLVLSGARAPGSAATVSLPARLPAAVGAAPQQPAVQSLRVPA